MELRAETSDIKTRINAILLYVDETILDVNIGNGYRKPEAVHLWPRGRTVRQERALYIAGGNPV